MRSPQSLKQHSTCRLFLQEFVQQTQPEIICLYSEALTVNYAKAINDGLTDPFFHISASQARMQFDLWNLYCANVISLLQRNLYCTSADDAHL